MSHLSLEALARIVDEPATSAEAAHLAACSACRDELDALRDDVLALGLMPELAPSPDAWSALEQRLAAEGLLHTRRRSAAFTRTAQLAAALVLFLAGSVAGRLTAAPQPLALGDAPGAATRDAVEQPHVVAPDPQPAATSPDDDAGSDTADPDRDVVDPDAGEYGDARRGSGRYAMPTDVERPGGSAGARLALDPVGGVRPASAADAATLLRQTEELYLAALTQYAEISSQAESGDPIARLAALQSIVLTTQAALQETPTDPVINGYHLTALAQRDATLAQVSAESSGRWY